MRSGENRGVMKLWDWLADPWTQAERDDENGVRSEAAARGATTAPGTAKAIERLRRRRRLLRLFGALAVVVAVAAFLAVLTNNLVVLGVAAAATASTAPVALFLGLRRD